MSVLQGLHSVSQADYCIVDHPWVGVPIGCCHDQIAKLRYQGRPSLIGLLIVRVFLEVVILPIDVLPGILFGPVFDAVVVARSKSIVDPSAINELLKQPTKVARVLAVEPGIRDRGFDEVLFVPSVRGLHGGDIRRPEALVVTLPHVAVWMFA